MISSQQSNTQPSSSSIQRSSSSIIIDDDRDIIIRSRSHTPILDEMSDTRSPIAPQRSRQSTPIIEPSQLLYSTPIIETGIASSKRVSFDNRNTLDNLETMMIKQGKQIRILYELQKTAIDKISRLQTQVNKLTSDKSNELSSKVFSVSNNLVCIIIFIIFRYLIL